MRIAPLAALALIASCVPHRDLPPDQIEKLGALSDVMDVQATIADPQFKKIGADAFTDAEWAQLADLGSRIQVTSHKALQFSKGPEFDAFANRLHDSAQTLSAAAAKKETRAASDALATMKATCKACHSKFK